MHNLDTIIGIMDIMIVKKGPDHQWRSDSQLLLDQYLGLAISIWPEVVSVLFEVAKNDQTHSSAGRAVARETHHT